jgi:hypothetical protein
MQGRDLMELIMRTGNSLAMAAAALSMLACSTAAGAAPVPAPAPNAWMVLSVLGPARATALGGANAAAQPADLPPPPPPATAGLSVTAEIIPFALWFGLIALALTSSESTPRANTPA